MTRSLRRSSSPLVFGTRPQIGLDDGTAAWFRTRTADGHSVFDGSVGLTESGADLTLDAVARLDKAVAAPKK